MSYKGGIVRLADTSPSAGRHLPRKDRLVLNESSVVDVGTLDLTDVAAGVLRKALLAPV
jgi:hypothetical protein